MLIFEFKGTSKLNFKGFGNAVTWAQAIELTVFNIYKVWEHMETIFKRQYVYTIIISSIQVIVIWNDAWLIAAVREEKLACGLKTWGLNP